MRGWDGCAIFGAVSGSSLAKASAELRASPRKKATVDSARGITKAYVSHCLGEALDGIRSSVFSELGAQPGTLKREKYRSWFQEPYSSGLGWSFPTALGAKLANPERVCVATMGDGSYMFSNPTVCHQIAEALELPVLVIVLDNEEWGAVRASASGMYPKGFASRANQMPLTALTPSPDFIATASASRAWARRRAPKAQDLPKVLSAVLKMVRNERRVAFLDIKMPPD